MDPFPVILTKIQKSEKVRIIKWLRNFYHSIPNKKKRIPRFTTAVEILKLKLADVSMILPSLSRRSDCFFAV